MVAHNGKLQEEQICKAMDNIADAHWKKSLVDHLDVKICEVQLLQGSH
jgi:hypothetical protein